MRHPLDTFLVTRADGSPLAVHRGLPKSELLASPGDGEVLVYAVGRLTRAEHRHIEAAVTIFRDMNFSASATPPRVFFRGERPFMRVAEDGKEVREGLRGMLGGLLGGR
jgi:hypothetical protein